MEHQYIFEATLPPETKTYVRRKADAELYQKLIEGKFCYAFNARKMGKSSLAVRVMQELTEKAEVNCVFIDLSQYDTKLEKSDRWYANMLDTLAGELLLEVDLASWLREREWLSPLGRFRQFIESVMLPQLEGEKVAIFIDEIDSVLSLDFPTDDFFAFIRGCYNNRAIKSEYNNLTFCLLGVATPSDLIADKTRTPFNIGRAIELTGFTFDEAKDALTPGLSGKVYDPEATLKQILDWTGGQPFLTQKLCSLVGSLAEGFSPYIPQLVESYVINHWEGQDNPEHLKTIRDRILKNEQNASRLLGLYRRVLTSKVLADASPEQMELRLSGLVVKRNGYLKVYNPIYREIFSRGWIEAELNKLRPYSQAINGWLKSERQDRSRLLRGEALQEAVEWGRDRNLGAEDYAFLSASQELERQEIQRVLEAEKEAKEILERANQEAKFLIKNAQEIVSLELNSEDALEKFKSSQIEGLLWAMKAGQSLQKTIQVLEEEHLIAGPIFALQQILTKIKERNQIPHARRVNSVSFSPDGKLLATASNDRAARLWDVCGKQIAEFVEHTDKITSISFSPDSKLLATASNDCTARLWNLEGKQIIEFIGHIRGVTEVCFSPSGKQLATASYDGTARLWDVCGQQIAEFVGHTDRVTSVSFSPDGRMLATASLDRTARLWDVKGKPIVELAGHTDKVTSVSFSPDGRMLATASYDRTARLWDVKGEQIASFKHRGAILSVSFSPDGRMLATASYDRTARLWELQGSQIAKFSGHGGVLTSVSFSPDGKMLATASSDRTLRLWEIKELKGSQIAKFAGHTDSVNSVSFSPNGKMLATASWDRTARLWDVRGKQIASLAGHSDSVNSVNFSPDGKLLATASWDKTARLWDVQGKQIASLAGHTDRVTSVSFSPDGKMVATTSLDRSARLWDVQGKQIASLAGHIDSVSSVSFSPDGTMLATASYDGNARLWDIQGKQIASFAGHTDWVTSISFSPDSKMLATASYEGNARLWDLKGNQIAEFVGHSDPLWSLNFSPDGKILATASYDSTARLWHMNGKQIAKFVGHTNSVNSVSFRPDGRMLATASSDGTVRLWRVENLEELLARGCEWLGGYFVNHPEALAELGMCWEVGKRHSCRSKIF